MTKIIKLNNKLYIAMIGILAILSYILNQCTVTYQCACVFIAILFLTNVQTLKMKPLDAYKYILLGILASLPIYAFKGYPDKKLIAISLISLLIAGCVSIYTTNKLKTKCSLPVALIITLLTASIVDGLLMSVYFITHCNFCFSKILNIFTRELFFKSVYGIASVLIIYSLGIIYGKKQSRMA